MTSASADSTSIPRGYIRMPWRVHRSDLLLGPGHKADGRFENLNRRLVLTVSEASGPVLSSGLLISRLV
jgi:hypothetical protein